MSLLNKEKMNSKSILIVLMAITAIMLITVIIYAHVTLYSTTQRESYPVYTKRVSYICGSVEIEGSREVLNGVLNTAERENVAVEEEYTEVSGLNFDEAIVSAVESNVDGIIVYSPDSSISAAVNFATSRNIPVITIGNDRSDSQSNYHFSTNINQFNETLNQVKKLGLKKASVLFVGRNDEIEQTAFKDLVDDNDEMIFVGTYHCQTEIFNSDEFYQYFNSAGEVDVICCGDSFSTIGTVQTIIDRNKVSQVSIIGYGQSQPILKFIQNRLVSASIAVDYKRIGEAAVETLGAIFNGNRDTAPEEIYPSVISIDNVDEYLHDENDENDEANK